MKSSASDKSMSEINISPKECQPDQDLASFSEGRVYGLVLHLQAQVQPLPQVMSQGKLKQNCWAGDFFREAERVFQTWVPRVVGDMPQSYLVS